jgi:hypothetical protein
MVRTASEMSSTWVRLGSDEGWTDGQRRARRSSRRAAAAGMNVGGPLIGGLGGRPCCGRPAAKSLSQARSRNPAPTAPSDRRSPRFVPSCCSSPSPSGFLPWSSIVRPTLSLELFLSAPPARMPASQTAYAQPFRTVTAVRSFLTPYPRPSWLLTPLPSPLPRPNRPRTASQPTASGIRTTATYTLSTVNSPSSPHPPCPQASRRIADPPSPALPSSPSTSRAAPPLRVHARLCLPAALSSTSSVPPGLARPTIARARLACLLCPPVRYLGVPRVLVVSHTAPPR